MRTAVFGLMPTPSVMNVLKDQYGRVLNYLRLSVTDRCNFRCYYCMPEEGIQYLPKSSLLTYEELYLLLSIFQGLGVSKLRITGGEPFVRAGLIDFLETLPHLSGIKEIVITSNGTLLEPYIERLKSLGVQKINLSLDSLDKVRFLEMTRRDAFDQVHRTMFKLLNAGFEVRLNCVINSQKNVQDIYPFIELTRQHPIAVRFLEEMPFNGTEQFQTTNWTYKEILNHISMRYSAIDKLEDATSSTSVNYKVRGYKGSFGVIPSFSRTFCGSCNRIRLSATGDLRTCLYGPPAANLRDLLRSGAKEADLVESIMNAVANREANGFKAEAANASMHHSMSVLGG